MSISLIFERLGRLPDATRALLLAVTAVIVGLATARVASSHYGATAIEVLLGVPLLVVLTPRPLIAVLILTAMLGSVFSYGALPRAHLPGGPPLNVADVLLLALLAGTIWRRPWVRWPTPVRAYALGLIVLFSLASVSSLALAQAGHATFRAAILGYRNLLFLALPLPIALEFGGRLWKPLLNALIVLAAIVSILSIAAALSSGVAHLLNHFAPAEVSTFSSPDSFTSGTRVRLPGLFLAYAMAVPTLALILTARDRRPFLLGAAFVLMLGAIAVSLNRNMYFGGIIGLLVAGVVGGPQFRHRLAATLVIVVACAVLVLGSVKPAATAAIENRATSALSTQVLSTGSARSRAIEFHYALLSIDRHPWDGVGWEQPYGLDVSALGFGSGPRVFVEDIYLHLATDYGIPAAIAFLLLPGILIGYGVRRARRAADPAERALLGAMVGAVVALLLSSLVGTYLQTPDSTVSYALACGLLLAAALRASPLLPAAPAQPSAAPVA